MDWFLLMACMRVNYDINDFTGGFAWSKHFSPGMRQSCNDGWKMSQVLNRNLHCVMIRTSSLQQGPSVTQKCPENSVVRFSYVNLYIISSKILEFVPDE